MLRRLLLLLGLVAIVCGMRPASPARADGWWAQTLRPADLWSGPDTDAKSFGKLPPGAYVQVQAVQPFANSPRLYVQETEDGAFGYVDAIALAPSGAPGSGAQTVAAGSPDSAPTAALFQPYWVANVAATQLWPTPTGSNGGADLQQFSKLLVLGPASGDRYYVQDARTDRLGYVDVALVGPSGPPEPDDFTLALPPPTNPSYKPTWVGALRATDLWSGVEGSVSLGRAAAGDQLLVMEPPGGPRLHVLNPKTKNYAFVDAAAVSPSKGPAAAAIEVKEWQGVVTGDVVNLRPEPHTFINASGQVRSGDVVVVAAWVEGEELDKDNRTWGRLTAVKLTAVKRRNSQGDLVVVPFGDDGAHYLYSGLFRPLDVSAPPEPPRNALGAGGAKWIDVNLSQQVVVAYQGDKSVHLAPTTSGRPGWETPTGTFHIQRRVENETMIGSTLLRLDTFEIPDYHLENVKWTQYFTGSGAALHTNYWRPGCLGMIEQHAKWFWDWTTVGTPLLIHF